jgi:hypothetical protein
LKTCFLFRKDPRSGSSSGRRRSSRPIPAGSSLWSFSAISGRPSGSGRTPILSASASIASSAASPAAFSPFYDAVPTPGQKDLLALDVLNPHYPDFYRAKDRKVPSDDQDPIPVSFLTVRAEAAFVFPFPPSPSPRRRAPSFLRGAHKEGGRMAGNRSQNPRRRRQNRLRIWLLSERRARSTPGRRTIKPSGAEVTSAQTA